MTLALASLTADRGTWQGAGAGAAAGAVSAGVVGGGLGLVLREGPGPMGMGAGLAAAGGAISGGLTGAFGAWGGAAATIATPALVGAAMLKHYGVNDISIMMTGMAMVPLLAGGITGTIAGALATRD